ncbi:MAG: response regulator [Desulfobacterales bacterium]|nr:response regulator [Desulfobacterales bacterium]
MLNRKKILIIDSSPLYRRILKEAIQKNETHVDVREAHNIDEAEDILKSDLSDVVFFDIAMPGSNGIDFITSIKDLVPNSRVVVLTSHDSTEYEAASIKKGADYFLSKEQSGSIQLMDVFRSAIRRT